ncbi:hypothetical protein Egran_03569 [Elaphomyces granulatus]|uniref:Uncharacterized protein n=1 Tax=Elaphomyces granulatus TaxID=519963 RepID=A0A232LWW7_9EURO|nr:hypothetical protein Egran_03569 [Elaphomyces granulatus]
MEKCTGEIVVCISVKKNPRNAKIPDNWQPGQKAESTNYLERQDIHSTNQTVRSLSPERKKAKPELPQSQWTGANSRLGATTVDDSSSSTSSTHPYLEIYRVEFSLLVLLANLFSYRTRLVDMANTTATPGNLSKRRRFQAPITKFFPQEATNTGNNDDHVGNPSHNNYAAPTHSPMPLLSPNIMSKLIGVGAQVRKAVHEGYKVGPLKYNECSISQSTANSVEVSHSGLSNSRSSSTELNPFCGMHKSDNLTGRRRPHSTEEFTDERMQVSSTEFDAMSLPGSGQESNTFSIFSVISRKRSFDWTPEELGDEGDGSSINQMLMGKIHSSCTTKGTLNTAEIWQDAFRLNDANEAFAPPSQSPRAILSPRIEQQRRLFTYSQKQPVTSTGQENFSPSAITHTMDMDIDDFGEAAFLRRREEVDSDYMEGQEVEIEMDEN